MAPTTRNVTTKAKITLKNIGIGRYKPIPAANTAPRAIWPTAPMLKRPLLKVMHNPIVRIINSEVLVSILPNDSTEPNEELIKAIGGIQINYDEKTLCCGSAVSRTQKDVSYEMCRRKYQSVTNAGAQLIAVNCPSCFQTLESNQKSVNKKYEKNFMIPIFYITELIALAFGYQPDELGIKFHTVGKKMDFLNVGIEK